MDSAQIERLNKLREERIAREKARIEKLREMNLKKYNKNESQSSLRQSVSSVSIVNRSVKTDTKESKNISTVVKNNFHVNGTTKRPITAPSTLKTAVDVKTSLKVAVEAKSSTKTLPNKDKQAKNEEKSPMKANLAKNEPKPTNVVNGKVPSKSDISTKPKTLAPVTSTKAVDLRKIASNNGPNMSTKVGSNVTRQSIATTSVKSFPKPSANARKSIQPPKTQTTNQNSRQSVFERLYKPKIVPKETVNNAMKLQTDPDYLKKVIKDSHLIMNKRHTMFDPKKPTSHPVRRSISAVHFKRISKNELPNCIHKWASIGEKLNKVNLQDVHEDDCVKHDIVVSAVKSERKKVKFQTPVPFNLNTPKPEELQSRLQKWLQKRGKSIDSFHHLQCFGLHHLAKEIKPLHIEPPKFDLYDDENKENVPLESDSDDDSYKENLNERKNDLVAENKVDFNKDKWRRASYVNDSVTDNNESTDTITSSEVMHHVDELLLGALNDLTELLKEGFDWEQCARWLRAIRDRFPSAPDNAAYWECRAALEERRGDLPASVQCWEEAIAKGTEHSVVEANLDQLLDKFLQLRISPSSGRRRQADPKMVDVKNVFKSTIIRFAVQQAKLRQSNQNEQSIPKFTVTPVRRSGRLSAHSRTQTPLRICASVKQAYELGPAEFRPNRTLTGSP